MKCCLKYKSYSHIIDDKFFDLRMRVHDISPESNYSKRPHFLIWDHKKYEIGYIMYRNMSEMVCLIRSQLHFTYNVYCNNYRLILAYNDQAVSIPNF